MNSFFTLGCSKCGIVLPENEIELSHDIPKYLGGTDLDGRRYLCRKCHDEYERFILLRVYESLFNKKIKLEGKRGNNIRYMVEIKNFLKNNPERAKKIKEMVKRLRDLFFNENKMLKKEVTNGTIQ